MSGCANNLLHRCTKEQKSFFISSFVMISSSFCSVSLVGPNFCILLFLAASNEPFLEFLESKADSLEINLMKSSVIICWLRPTKAGRERQSSFNGSPKIVKFLLSLCFSF